MPKERIWSDNEVRAVIDDYMSMLRQELAGQPYNKTRHRRILHPKLVGRSDASIEFKHQNISAALRDLGYLWIPGYLPAQNYQRSLIEGIEAWLAENPDFDDLAGDAAERRAVPREDIDLDGLIQESRGPARSRRQPAPDGFYDNPGTFRPIKRDYIAIEARNRSLGLAGEQLIVDVERHRLRRLGLDQLASRVEHVAQTRGDGCGFDVLSFRPDGSEHFIEVKTTGFAAEVPFFASPAEVRYSESHARQFSLVRVYAFRQSPRFFGLPGAISDHCRLDAASFRCRLR